jgi:site-specific recombinase XerD
MSQFDKYLDINDYSEAYFFPVKVFLLYCAEKSIKYLQVTYEQLMDFIAHLKNDKEHKNGTINNYVKSIKFFYNFLCNYSYIESGEPTFSEVSKLKQLPVEQTIKDTITIKEVDKIVELASGYAYPMHPYRMKALLYFMYFTGLRRQEIVDLKRKDIDMEEKQLVVRVPTKNRQERVAFFPNRAKNILEKYFKSEHEIDNAFNLTVGKINTLFAFLKNFRKDISPHMFRHSFTQHLASMGIDIRVAQQLLGHKSLATTMIYYNPNLETMKKIYRKKVK